MNAPRRTGPVEVVSLEQELARLHAQPLASFTESRNALASRLKVAGRPEDAAQVKALARPALSAWAVNQLAYRAPDALARLLASGDRLREEQQRALDGRAGDLRGALEERRQAVDAAARKAIEALDGDGTPATGATRDRIRATCEALAAFGTAPGAPQVGRLVADVEAPGLSALAGLTAALRDRRPAGATPTRSPASVAPARGGGTAAAPTRASDAADAAERKRGVFEAKRRVSAAQKTLLASRTARDEATRQLTQAQRAADKALADAEEVRARLRDLEARATAATEARLQAERALRETSRAHDAAERAVEDARRALEDVDHDER